MIEYWGVHENFPAEQTIDSQEYERRMKMKMAIYHRHRIPYLSIYPKNIETDFYRTKIEKFLSDLGRK